MIAEQHVAMQSEVGQMYFLQQQKNKMQKITIDDNIRFVVN